MGFCQWTNAWFCKVIVLIFYMLREPIVQELISNKREILSCIESIKITDFETGEVICQDCGKVLEEKISNDRKDSNMFSKSEHASHFGSKSPLRFHDMGLATIIGRFNHDSTGKPVTYKMRPVMKRIRFWDTRSHTKTSADRNLRTALCEMEKLKEKLSLSDAIIERSAYIYRKAARAQLIRGRSIYGIVGACVYAACREVDVTRTIVDISKNLQQSRNSVAKNYRLLLQNLKLAISVPDPVRCIIKISNNLDIPENTKREAIDIFDILKKKNLIAGKKPNSVAAAVIYIAKIKTGVNLSQSKISKVSGVTSVTVRNRYKEYKKHV